MLTDKKEIAEKLNNLQKYMPGEPPQLYEFGEYLSKMLDSGDIEPCGLNLLFESAVSALEEGVDAHTGEKVSSRLTGYPPIYYTVLRIKFDAIAKAVLPKEFYEEFKEVRK